MSKFRCGAAAVRALVVLLSMVAALSHAAASRAATDFTWSGGTANAGGSANWSDGGNWVGGATPTAANVNGVVTFPYLGYCDPLGPTHQVCQSTNNLAGAGFSGMSFDPRSNYSISGSAITLGSGGVTTTGSSGTSYAAMRAPLALSADQTWTLAAGGLQIWAGATGSSNLAVGAGNGYVTFIGSDTEIGTVTSQGNVDLQSGGSLNGTNGHQINVQAGYLTAFGPTADSVGQLNVTGGSLQVGTFTGPVTLNVNGAASLGSSSRYLYELRPTGGSSLSATGAVSLAGSLSLSDDASTCAAFTPGTMYTVASGSSLSGTFANAPQGGYMNVTCADASTNYAAKTFGVVRISYSGTAVTATVVASPTLTASAPSSASAGSPIPASSIPAVLSGGNTPSGTLTYKVYGPQATAPTNCSTGGTTVGTATASGDGSYPPSAGYTPPSPGNYWWYASYGGDTANNAATSACGSSMAETVVGKAAPTLSASGPSGGTVGSSIVPAAISGVLAGGSAPTGTVTFSVYGPQAAAPSDCSTGGTAVGTATASGDGTYHPSAGFTPSAPGNYWWYASYAGDGNNSGAAAVCGAQMSETVVGTAAPALSASGPATGTAGSGIDASSISGVLSGGSAPTGTVTFSVYGPQAAAPSDCSTGGTAVGTATASGDGTYHPSAGFTPSAPGNYWWYANYAGDGNNSGAAAVCGAQMSETVVAKAGPTVHAGAPGAGTVGSKIDPAKLPAALSGGDSPTGSLIFKVYGPQSTAPADCSAGGTTVGTATASGDGSYAPSAGFTPSAPGSYWWYVSYAGDANNAAAGSACGDRMTETVVAKAAPALAVSAPAAGTSGTTIDGSAVTATLSGGSAPTGAISFKVYGPQAAAPTDCSTGGTSAGTATASDDGQYHPSTGFTPAAAGDYWWYASYAGDANNSGASSNCGAKMAETTVGQAPPPNVPNSPVTPVTPAASRTSLTCVPSSLVPAAVTRCTATVTGAAGRPTGTVTLSSSSRRDALPDHKGCSLRAAAARNASACSVALTAGSAIGHHLVTAHYGGDPRNAPSSAHALVRVARIPVRLHVESITGSAGPGCRSVIATVSAANRPARCGRVLVTVTIAGPEALNGRVRVLAHALYGRPEIMLKANRRIRDGHLQFSFVLPTGTPGHRWRFTAIFAGDRTHGAALVSTRRFVEGLAVRPDPAG